MSINGKPYNYNTLEPKLLKANGNDISLFNKILGTKFDTIEDLQKFMKSNKTESALSVFETNEDLEFPNYILEAIKE